MSGNVKFDKWINDDNSENYKCRAWVNFDGLGTVSIREAGNVSSITDFGSGDYFVNFTTAMLDVNYCIQSGVHGRDNENMGVFVDAFNNITSPTTTSVRIMARRTDTHAYLDVTAVHVAIFR